MDVVLIYGVPENKDAAGFLRPFRPLGPRVLAIPFEAEAAASPEAIAQAARANGLDAQVCASLDEALGLALAGDGPAPHVLICGSLYLAGEVLAASPETWPV